MIDRTDTYRWAIIACFVACLVSIALLTGLPVIIYNVVPWTYLSPALLTRIMREVPMVIGVKQSAGDLKLFADLMMMAPDKLIYSAVDALMYPSYTLGAHGSIAAILTALGFGVRTNIAPEPPPASRVLPVIRHPCDAVR